MTGRMAMTSPSGVSTHDRPLGDRLHRQDRDLGDVDDRHRQVRAEPAGVVDGECAAAVVVELELAGPGACGDLGDRVVQAADRELVDVADDRNEQPVVDRHGDPHVDPTLGQEAVLGPVGVERRVAPERLDGGLDDERDVAERDPLARLVVALGRLAGPHEVGRIDLHVDVGVRDGQGAGHLCRDALAHLGHRQQDFVGAFGERDRRACGCGGCRRARCGGSGCGRAVLAGGRGAAGGRGGGRGGRRIVPPVRIDSTTLRTSSRVIRPPPPVPTIWAAVRSCSRSSRRTAGVIRASGSALAGGAATAAAVAAGRRSSEPAGPARREPLSLPAGPGSGLGRSRGRRGRRGGRRVLGRRRRPEPPSRRRCRVTGARRRRCIGARARVVGGLDDRDLGVVGDGRPFLGKDLAQGPLERRRDLGVDLVGDDLDQRLVLGDMIARLLQPLPDRPLGDALAELGHRHLGHVRCSSVGAGRPARWGLRMPLVSPIAAQSVEGSRCWTSGTTARHDAAHDLRWSATVRRGTRAIGIRPGEGRTVAFVAGLFAALEVGRGFGEIGVDTLVVSQIGPGVAPLPVHRARGDRPDHVARIRGGAGPGRPDPPARRAARRRRRDPARRTSADGERSPTRRSCWRG